jgi:hypothetical protein
LIESLLRECCAQLVKDGIFKPGGEFFLLVFAVPSSRLMKLHFLFKSLFVHLHRLARLDEFTF